MTSARLFAAARGLAAVAAGLVTLGFASCGRASPAPEESPPTGAPAAVEPGRHPEPASEPEGPPVIAWPEDPAWLEALAVGGEVQRPQRLSGRKPDLFGGLGGGRYYLGVCFLGLLIDTSGGVERAYFMGPSNASDEIRNLLLDVARDWRFRPATRAGVAVRVRHILSVSHCPYLPSDGGPAEIEEDHGNRDPGEDGGP